MGPGGGTRDQEEAPGGGRGAVVYHPEEYGTRTVVYGTPPVHALGAPPLPVHSLADAAAVPLRPVTRANPVSYRTVR